MNLLSKLTQTPTTNERVRFTAEVKHISEDMPRNQTGVLVPKPTTPVRTIEKLGFHHGEGLWRVQVNDNIFYGNTEQEAIAEAVISTFEAIGPFTINIIHIQ